MKYDKTRNVGGESRRTYLDKIETGFFDKYMSGNGIEIGSTGYEKDIVPILETAKSYNLGDEGYDGLHLPISPHSIDYIYSSHVIEHLEDYKSFIQEWYRVLRVGGFMVIIAPHQFLYERKLNKPSRWNGDHKHFITPAKLLSMVEESLEPNSYRVRLLEDGDKNYDYSIGDIDTHPTGQYEITLVLEKIQTPFWKLK